jgi:AbrB family looped-hinge helix DNA binding protein
VSLATVTSKHQITIPRDVRRELNVGKGDQLVFEKQADGVIVISKKAPVVESDGAAVPFVRTGKLSLSEMKAAAARGALESVKRRDG